MWKDQVVLERGGGGEKKFIILTSLRLECGLFEGTQATRQSATAFISSMDFLLGNSGIPGALLFEVSGPFAHYMQYYRRLLELCNNGHVEISTGCTRPRSKKSLNILLFLKFALETKSIQKMFYGFLMMFKED